MKESSGKVSMYGAFLDTKKNWIQLKIGANIRNSKLF